jgi:integrase
MTRSQPPIISVQDTLSLVQAYIESCRTRGLSKETLRYYSDFLLKLAKEYHTIPDTPEQLEAFVCHFQSSDSRRHGAFRAVRAFYNWAEQRYNIDNTMKKVGAPRVRPTERPALTIEQLKKLLEYPYQSNLTKALLFFLADTGVRIGEAANLTSADIYEDSVKVHGKTGERIIPISPMVRELLIELGTGKVFKYCNRELSGRVIRAGRLAGVKVCPHDLRRTFATNWRGSDLSLKYIGGWASWKMVEHYSRRKLDKAQDDHKKFSPVAIINPNHTLPQKSAEVPLTPAVQASTDTIIRLAEELGAAKERIRQLEAELLLTQVKGV